MVFNAENDTRLVSKLLGDLQFSNQIREPLRIDSVALSTKRTRTAKGHHVVSIVGSSHVSNTSTKNTIKKQAKIIRNATNAQDLVLPNKSETKKANNTKLEKKILEACTSANDDKVSSDDKIGKKRPGAWAPANDEQTRERAMGTERIDDENLQVLTAPEAWSLFPPLPKPQRGDWLAAGEPGMKDRKGQTYRQFNRYGPGRTFPTRQRNTIYMVPISCEKKMGGALDVEQLRLCVEAHFCLPVVIDKQVTAEEIATLKFTESIGYGEQLDIQTVFNVLRARLEKKKKAFLVIGFTMLDLTQDNFNYLFGCASPISSTGVFSFARFQDDDPVPSQFLRRCGITLTHEIGHLIGMKHCVWSKCIMNGSNHLEESFNRPFAFCPCNLKMLASTLKPIGVMNAKKREEKLHAFFLQNNLIEDANAAQARIDAMTSAMCHPCI